MEPFPGITGTPQQRCSIRFAPFAVHPTISSNDTASGMQFRLPWPPKRSQQRQRPGTCLRGRRVRVAGRLAASQLERVSQMACSWCCTTSRSPPGACWGRWVSNTQRFFWARGVPDPLTHRLGGFGDFWETNPKFKIPLGHQA